MKTNRMSCGEAREKLPLYVGGDLDLDVLDAVRAHLDECDACAVLGGDALRARRELVAAFRQPQALSAPSLWPGIRATLRAEGRIHEGDAVRPLAAPARARRPHWGWALAPVAAAAALLLVAQLGGGGLERAREELPPIVEAPIQAPEAELVSAPAPTGGLKSIPADRRQLLRAFQPRQEELAPDGDASLASFGARKVR